MSARGRSGVIKTAAAADVQPSSTTATQHKDVGLDPFPDDFRNHLRTGGGPGAGADDSVVTFHNFIRAEERRTCNRVPPSALLPRRTAAKIVGTAEGFSNRRFSANPSCLASWTPGS